MAHSEDDDEEFDRSTEGDDDIDEDILDTIEGSLLAEAEAEEASEVDDDSLSDDSDGGSDDDDLDGDEPSSVAPGNMQEELRPASEPSSNGPSSQRGSPEVKAPSPVPVRRSLSPAQIRKSKLLSDLVVPRSFTVEAICAIPHPVPTHCLASSLCMTHLLTGSDDGYIRDYDVFAAVNGKNFLTAPQRHHCGVMEGLMKAGQIKCWWENPLDVMKPNGPIEDSPLCSVYSLALHSDALWALAGSNQGHINLFTVRHDPGRLCHAMRGHRGPVSALALQHDEKGFFSAGWDGEALHWDLNTGQIVRNFTAHGAQMTSIAVRPLASNFSGYTWHTPPPVERQLPTSMYHPESGGGPQQGAVGSSFPVKSEAPGLSEISMNPLQSKSHHGQNQMTAQAFDEDSKSDTSFDPLFDDEPDGDGEFDTESVGPSMSQGTTGTSVAPYQEPHQVHAIQVQAVPRSAPGPMPAAKNAPPILDPASYMSFSPNVIMTAYIDGQIVLWDTRVHSPGTGVGRLWMSEKTPPWCLSACWSADGGQIYAGRRNGTVDIFDVRQTGRTSSQTPRILKILRNPISSGVVSCVVAFPDGRHLACASNDNIRLWNVADAGEPDASGKMKSGVQFKIIPGHHGGYISQMLVDPAARFLVTASSNRGWHGESTRTVFVHEIRHVR
ncbi:WD40 repeat-like protein [Amylocystis lapponica]|nr:WD40 repeat-like protein [Amylocystis lapponica]